MLASLMVWSNAIYWTRVARNDQGGWSS